METPLCAQFLGFVEEGEREGDEREKGGGVYIDFVVSFGDDCGTYNAHVMIKIW